MRAGAAVVGHGHGVERRTQRGKDFEPDQSVPFDDWLVAYTAVRRTPVARKTNAGCSRRGCAADLVVLDRDGGGGHAGRGARVLETWVAGERVFSTT